MGHPSVIMITGNARRCWYVIFVIQMMMMVMMMMLQMIARAYRFGVVKVSFLMMLAQMVAIVNVMHVRS